MCKGGFFVMDLKEKTIILKKHTDELKNRYESHEPPENRKDRDFFQMVKTETSPIYDLLAQWEEETLAVVKTKNINLHPHQVTSTRENLELLLMHSYLIDARRKRYMELNHSVQYIFDQLVRELDRLHSDATE